MTKFTNILTAGALVFSMSAFANGHDKKPDTKEHTTEHKGCEGKTGDDLKKCEDAAAHAEAPAKKKHK